MVCRGAVHCTEYGSYCMWQKWVQGSGGTISLPVAYPGCAGFFLCCSCHHYLQEFRCLPVWVCQCSASVHEVQKWNSSHPHHSPEGWIDCADIAFHTVRKPFPPTCQGFYMWPEGWADNRHMNALHDVWNIYLPATNQQWSFATWLTAGDKPFPGRWISLCALYGCSKRI